MSVARGENSLRYRALSSWIRYELNIPWQLLVILSLAKRRTEGRGLTSIGRTGVISSRLANLPLLGDFARADLVGDELKDVDARGDADLVDDLPRQRRIIDGRSLDTWNAA
jgi:hypothetical protein